MEELSPQHASKRKAEEGDAQFLPDSRARSGDTADVSV